MSADATTSVINDLTAALSAWHGAIACADAAFSHGANEDFEWGEAVGALNAARRLASCADAARAQLADFHKALASGELYPDLSGCPAYDGKGTCQSGCWEEPACQVDEPIGGWPAKRIAEAERRGAVKALRELIANIEANQQGPSYEHEVWVRRGRAAAGYLADRIESGEVAP